MDFTPEEYTEEQEEFAKEVRAWLDENVPEDLIVKPWDMRTMSREQWELRREFARTLGQKGWLHPTAAREYGGGGLDADHAAILNRELAARDLSAPAYGYDANPLALPAILAVATEEQKKRFLPPIYSGEVVAWQLFTEPEAGTDAANQQTNAVRHVRDKDHFIVNGQKIFIGSRHGKPERLLLLTRSDLEAPRHENLAMFYAPADLPGVSITPLDLFPSGIIGQIATGPGSKNSVFLDDVRIHEDYLIGGERDGWRAANATLGAEHGDRPVAGGAARGGRPMPRQSITEKFLDQCKNNPDVKKRLRENPHLLDSVLNVYIGAEIQRLWSLRNAGMAGSGRRIPGAGPQSTLYSKMFGTRFIADMAEVLGPYALTTDDELGLDEGLFEVGQRNGICAAPGGTPEALKIIISRALRIGR